MITRKALMILENQMVFGRTVNRAYDDSYAIPGAKIGTTLRIRLPDRALVTKGAALQAQAENQQFTTLTVSEQAHIGLTFTSAELTMELDDFAELIIKPRVSQLAASIDADIATVYKSIYNTVGTPGTTPGTSLVLLQAQRKLNEYAAPMDARYAAINPAANTELVEGTKGLFNPVEVIARQFKKGIISSDILGYDEINMTQSIVNHTNGTRSTSDNILVNGAVTTQGSTTINLDGGTGSATINKGDVFVIDNVYMVNPQTREIMGDLQQFVCTSTSTASGGAWTSVEVSPPMYTADHALATINAFPQNNAAVAFVGAGGLSFPQNIIYHKDAITFATADLILPKGVDMASRQVHNGVSMRLLRQYDVNNDQLATRLDVLYGFATIRPEVAVRLVG